MRDALDDQIDAYHALLPQLRERYGSVWALVAGRMLVSTFPDFSSAARYADAHLPAEQVLIRHTDEKPEFVPFVHIDA